MVKKRNRELLSCMLTPCISLVEECVMITLSSPGHYCWTVWLDLMSRINKENCVSKPSKRKVLSLTSSLSKREKTVQTVQNTKSKTKTKPGKHKVSQRFAGQGFVLLLSAAGRGRISGRVFEMANEPITSCHIAASPKWLTLSDFLILTEKWFITIKGTLLYNKI